MSTLVPRACREVFGSAAGLPESAGQAGGYTETSWTAAPARTSRIATSTIRHTAMS
ncbi:hypothetical protein ABIA39_004154, partial [Nocardia sp. GAS34]